VIANISHFGARAQTIQIRKFQELIMLSKSVYTIKSLPAIRNQKLAQARILLNPTGVSECKTFYTGNASLDMGDAGVFLDVISITTDDVMIDESFDLDCIADDSISDRLYGEILTKFCKSGITAKAKLSEAKKKMKAQTLQDRLIAYKSAMNEASKSAKPSSSKSAKKEVATIAN
jgi:hypothetical protein